MRWLGRTRIQSRSAVVIAVLALVAALIPVAPVAAIEIADPTIIYVDNSVDGPGSGTAEDPFALLGDGLAAAVDGQIAVYFGGFTFTWFSGLSVGGAGDRYEAVGKVEKGREHKALARLIWPVLDPAAITESDQPSAAELLATGRARPLGATADAATPALNSFFLRFVGALLDEDADAVAGFLDGSVYLSSVPVEGGRGQAATPRLSR